MGLSEALAALGAEIVKLKQVPSLRADGTVAKRRPGRPRAVVTLEKPAKLKKPSKKKKRNLTPEGRARISAAVKKRWERQKKAWK